MSTAARGCGLAAVCACSVLLLPSLALAQAGPPFLSNDPGTPGNANWEINLAAAPTLTRRSTLWQLPQLDMNYGIGERVQLTFEIPYVLADQQGLPSHAGWGNATPGIKWRFLDQGDEGWQASVFPQVQAGASRSAIRDDVAAPGPRYLLPLEISHRIGSTVFNLEYGQYLPAHGPRERILGAVAGQSFSPRLELDAELYDDRTSGAEPQTIMDVGGRYRFRPDLLGLFMIGRGLHGSAGDEVQWTGYFGIQLLLGETSP